MPKTIMFDMDGVLADFVLAYSTLANKRYGTLIRNTEQQTQWAFDMTTSAQEGVIWGRDILPSDTYWEKLNPLVGEETFERIHKLNLENIVYFVTARKGNKVKEQTERWLYRHGIARPTVIISKFKGEVAKAVGAQYAIDDKPENCFCTAWISPKTVSCIQDRLYNRYDPDKIGSSKVRRVATVNEYLDIIEGKTI